MNPYLRHLRFDSTNTRIRFQWLIVPFIVWTHCKSDAQSSFQPENTGIDSGIDSPVPTPPTLARVARSNHAPVIVSSPIVNASEASTYYYAVLAEDLDGDLLQFTLENSPQEMTIHKETGLISWLPKAGSAGSTSVRIRVSDPQGASVEQRYDINIARGQNPPRIVSLPIVQSQPNALYRYLAQVEDPDDTTFTWSVRGPVGMSVDSSGILTWNVPTGTTGNVPISLTVRDRSGLEDTQTFSIGIHTPGDTKPPVVALKSPLDGAEITSITDAIGTVEDDALAGYQLELCRHTLSTDCLLITQGVQPVRDALVGQINPFLLPTGTHVLRLSAQDAAGNKASTEQSITLPNPNQFGVLRLVFSDLYIQTQTFGFWLKRVYDGLDLRLGQLGKGWRYEWNMGRVDQPQLLAEGWNVIVVPNPPFPPTYQIAADFKHPLTFTLPDSRVSRFLVTFQDIKLGGGCSVCQIKPVFINVSGDGTTLTAFSKSNQSYTELGNEPYIAVGNNGVFEDSDPNKPWEPARYELRTQWGEVASFDAKSRELTRFQDASGAVIEKINEELKVNNDSQIRFEKSADGLVRAVVDIKTGRRLTYERDVNQDLVKVTTIDNQTQTFEYSKGSRLVRYTVPGRGPERFEYDSKGRLISQISPNGTVMRTTYQDDRRRVLKTDALGNSVTLEYDAAGYLIKSIDPFGYATTFENDPKTGLLLSRTDPLGHSWKVTYDAQKRRVEHRNPLGIVEQFKYKDSFEKPVKFIDGEGRIFAEEVDTYGRATAYVQPDGKVARSFIYGTDTITITNGLGFQSSTQIDARGRTIKDTQANGAVTTTTYDDSAHTATVRNAFGKTSTMSLDPFERITKLETDAHDVFQYQYGGGSLPNEVTRPDGVKINYKKDTNAQINQIMVGGTPTMNIRRNALGQIASTQNATGNQSYRYDAAGRLTHVVSSTGTLQYQYDAAGRMTDVSNGKQITSMAYDEANRPSEFAVKSGQNLKIDYDKSDRIRALTNALGHQVKVLYDTNGRLQKAVYPGGLEVEKTYYPSDGEEDDTPLQSFRGFDGLRWNFTYDSQELLASVTDETGAKTSYERNIEGEITKVTDALTHVTQVVRDDTQKITILPSGRRSSCTKPDATGRIQCTRADSSVVTYQRLGNDFTVSLPNGDRYYRRELNETGASLNWGAPGGGMVRYKNQKGWEDYIQREDGAHTELNYSIDEKLLGLSAVTPHGETFNIAYTYNAGGQLDAMTVQDKMTLFSYDKAGRLTRIERPGNVSTEIEYAKNNRPLHIQHFQQTQKLSEFIYEYDRYGRMSMRQTPQGRTQFEYDRVGRLVLERQLVEGKAPKEIRREYDAVGNLTTLIEDTRRTTFTYDADDRLLTRNASNGVTTYRYNERGALTQIEAPEGTTTFTYDDLDRLTQVAKPNQKSVSYRYDTEGQLLVRIDEQGEQHCLPLPETPFSYRGCVAFYSPSKDLSTTWTVPGPTSISEIHKGTQVHYLLHDAQQSVISSYTADGISTGTYEYDPWGVRTTRQGEALSVGYHGEFHDPATGLIYLRARWYHPELGRFMTPDPADFTTGDPRTLHRYVYALNDPLNRTDPSGRSSLAEFITSDGMQQILNNITQLLENCIKQELQHQLFKEVGRYITEHATGWLRALLKAAIADLDVLGGGRSEESFHKRIAELLCGSNNNGSFGANGQYGPGLGNGGLWTFEYQVEKCGAPKKRKSGVSYYRNCLSPTFNTNNGIDIVFADMLPIEIKLSEKGIKDPNQLPRYCRFASAYGKSYSTIYVFGKFPEYAKHDEYAKKCWNCWDSPCESQGGPLGSIYLSMGILPNSETEMENKHFYVPNASICNKVSPVK